MTRSFEHRSVSRLAAEFDQSGQTVASYTLRRHERVARIRNPARNGDGEIISRLGGRGISGPRDVDWAGLARELPGSEFEPPMMGSIDPAVVAVLIDSLPLPEDRHIGVAQWDGYADVEYDTSGEWVVFPPGRRSLARHVLIDELLLLERVPMRWWHPEMQWVLGNDIYARSIYLSGTSDVIDRVLRGRALDSWTVDFDDPAVPET